MQRALIQLHGAPAAPGRFIASCRRIRSWFIRGLLGGLVLMFCGDPGSARAQSLGRMPMFDTANLPSGDAITNEIGAKRARFIRVNSTMLTAEESPLHQPAPAQWNLDSSRVELDLFEDTYFTAAIEKTLYRNGTNFLARGVIDGWEGSQVILAADGSRISATVRLPGRGTYSIRPAGEGLHKVIEVDLARIPNCGPQKKAPAKPRPIVVKRKKVPPVRGTDPGGFAPKSDALQFRTPLFDPLQATPPIEPDASSNTNIDVMVVYTSSARDGAGGTASMNTLIDLIVAEANSAYENSLIPVTLNLVFRGEVTYNESGNAATDLTRLQNPNDGHMDGVHVQRNQYGADLVCLITESMASYAGLGYMMSNVSTNFSSYAFSVIRRVYAEGTETFAHELGHNMGCAHDRQNSTSRGAYPYSYGHRFTAAGSVYRTVMAYSPGERIRYFSNPNVTHLGVATGVAAGATNAADNATTISNTAPIVASFRAPVVLFSAVASSNTVAESNGTVSISLSRRSLTNVSATVNFTLTAGTATADVDYVSTNGTVEFAAGETSKSVTIALVDDALKENTEMFVLRLNNPSAGGIYSSNTTIYVTDDDASQVGLASTAATVAENTNSFSISVERTGSTNTAISVTYFTANGTATAASDFISTNGILAFAPGETNKSITVAVINDQATEINETFFVRLRTSTNTTLTASTNFTVTIVTNDSALFAFSSATSSTDEGSNSVTLTVVRTGTTNNTASVDYFTTNVTALAGSDFVATNGSLSFAPGETNQTITIGISEDDLLELSKTFRVILTKPDDGRITAGTNTVTITDNDASLVGFTASTASVDETNDVVTLTVVRTGATNTAVAVDFTTINGTALAGGDYTTNSGTLSFAAGVTTNTIEIEITENRIQEATNETFQVRLSNVSNTILGVGTNTVTIVDDDASGTGFSVASLNVAEDTNSVSIFVVRTGSTNTEVSLVYATLTNGTAVAGTDFRATNGVLVFAAGVTTNSFALGIINDALPEVSETINLRLSNATNTTFGTTNLTITILTNDSSVMNFTSTTNLVSETNGTLTLTVYRTGTTNNAASVEFFTTNLTATAGADYVGTNGTVVFAPGETTNTFAVSITDDNTYESAETFRVVLRNPNDATILQGTNIVTIADDDASLVGFTASTASVDETNDVVTLTVVRTGATNTAVAVDFTTINGTALAGSDYTTNSGTLSFAAGVTTNTIEIEITENRIQEATNETFQVRLSNVSNTILGVGTNTVTIVDDDASGTGFSVASLNVAEDTNSVSIFVVRTGSTNTEVSLVYATLTNGTAVAGTDFRATNGVLVFAAGVTTNSFALGIINDALPEVSETINLRLSNATNTTFGTTNLTITILTNDSSVMNFTATTNLVSETNGTLTLTVYRTGTTNNAASVEFFTTNVTATAGADYVGTNGTVVFAPGETTNTFAVSITDDNTYESAETFRVVLRNPNDATILQGTNIVTIADDDASLVGFTASTASVDETNDVVTLTVVRTGATNTAVAVDFTTINGTALAGSDYTTNSGTLSFAAGVTTNTIEIEITENRIQEATNETFQVRLSNVSNTILGVGTNTVTIVDDDASGTGFSVASLNVAEDTNSVSIFVVRTGSTNTEVSLVYATLTNGTAVAGNDFRATNGVLVFAAGVTTNSFALGIINDALPEVSETINLRLSNATNTTFGTTNFTITILTNDSSVMNFTATTNLVSETNGTLTLTVYRTGTTNNAASVEFFTTNLTATAGADYVGTNGTVAFAPGETTNTFAVSITDDNTYESAETFRVVLRNPNDATILQGTNIVTIADDDASLVGFTASTASVDETNDVVTLTVVRTGATNTAVAVDFTTINGTALAGSDYTTNSGTLSFAAGVTTNTIEIEITENRIQEATNETFQVRLSNVSNTILGVGTNTVTIVDDDASGTGFSVASLNVAEDTNSVSIFVVRTGSTNTEVSLVYATLTNGTAVAGTDFRATNGVLVFAAGVTTNSFALGIINDALPEVSETINLRLSNATNTTFGTTNLTITILTNDSSVMNFTSTTNLVSETNGTLTLTVYRTGTTNNAASVEFFTTNLTATAGADYVGTNGTVAFAPGETTNTFAVSITDDNTYESAETFRVVLRNPNDATILQGTNIVTIADDDASLVGFTASTASVDETNDVVTLTVVRTGATNTAVAVDFTTINGTALAGSDYTTNSGTLSFAAGVTTNTIEIEITENRIQEATNETFQVRLSNVSNTILGVGTNTVTIVDDDASGTGFSVASLNVAEDTNSVSIIVVRTGSTNTEVSLVYATLTNGTAVAGSDFRATNGVLVFAAGVTTNSFALGIINDALPEVSETINLRLSNATNTTFGTTNLTLTILTNDSSVMNFTATTNLVSETNGTLTLTVYRTGTTNNAASVEFFTTNLTATAGADYVGTNGTVAFAPGETTNTFAVSITDDNTYESAETFRVVLRNPNDATILQGTNIVTIADDDASLVGFTASTASVDETNDVVTLTVVRTGATNTAVAVDFTTINGTALAGSDYTTNSGTLSFAAGVTTNTIEIEITENRIQEATNETFQVRLSNVSNTILGVGTNTVTIVDDDASGTGFSVASLNVAEDTNSVSIFVVRTGSTNTEVSLVYATLTNGTAVAGNDFRATNGVLVFAAGVTTNSFALGIINDALPEVSETINLRLSNATNTTFGTTNLTLTILTNDSSVMNFTSTTNLVSETNGTLTLTVYRTGTTNNAASVEFFTTNLTATAGADYVGTNGTVAFAPGETTNTFAVSITDDNTYESAETFRVVLRNPNDATILQGTNIVTIADDDASLVGFTASTASVDETNDVVTLTVVRTGATNTAVAVDFTTINGTALAGSDYTTNSGTLSFAAGVTTNTIEIELADDFSYEANETFRVVLRNVDNTALATGTNTVTIADNDIAYVGFVSAAESVGELDGSITLIVERTGSTNTSVSVAYATSNLTAVAGADYTAATGVVEFEPGETNKEIVILVELDGDIESSETFRLRLFNFTNSASATYTNLTVTINEAFGGQPPAGGVVAITSIRAVGTNELRLLVTGPPNVGVGLESTTDFKTWVLETTGTIKDGFLAWTLPIDPAVPARYFRVVPPRQ